MNEKIFARFWSKVDKNGPIVRPELGPCWIWTGHRNKKGYGYFHVDSVVKMKLATHVALLSIGIEVPKGMQAAHACHNPPCVNMLRHLTVTTGSENVLMSFRDGRKDFRGEGCPRAKLTAIEVLEIRRRHAEEDVTIEILARTYNVCDATISHILTRRNWKHI